MEEEVAILCDTDVIIEFYKNNHKIVSELHLIGENNIAISIITAAELIFGALNKKELKQIKKDIKNLKTLHLNHQTENIFLQLLEKYSLSHNLKIPDALIASTAIANETELFTLNKKDFKFIKELKLYQFP